MTSTLQIIVLGVLGALFGLSALSRRYPHIAWLQAFRINRPNLTEEQKARMRRRALSRRYARQAGGSVAVGGGA